MNDSTFRDIKYINIRMENGVTCGYFETDDEIIMLAAVFFRLMCDDTLFTIDYNGERLARMP